MPRGVYQRKSADEVVKPAAKKTAQPKKLARPSKPLVQRPLVLTPESTPPVETPVATLPLITETAADVPPTATPDTAPPPVSAIPVVPLEREAPIRGSVDNMSGDTLKRYARQVGIQQRDVDGLTEDRLRQNCKAMIFAAMEDD